MRFTYLLAFLPALTLTSAQLDSLLSQASDLVTQSDVQSALSEASSAIDSLANDPSFTSVLASLTSEYASDIASITSAYGTDLASYTSVLGSAATDAAASASQAFNNEDAVNSVVIPAMGVVGAGILGLAALL
jgi:hypothetical protein